MKKLGFLAVVVFATCLMTGCGDNSKTLTCTNSTEQSGIKMDQSVSMTFKEDKISKVNMEINSKATSDTIKDNWDVFVNTLSNQFEEKNENGIKLSMSNDKKNYSCKISLAIDLEKADKDSLEEYDLDELADDDSTMSEVKKSAEDSGFTCR